MPGIVVMLPLLLWGPAHAWPARAQLSRKPMFALRLKKSAPPPVKAGQPLRESATWLFVVEEKTQWLMVLADTDPDGSNSQSDGAESGHNGLNSQSLRLNAGGAQAQAQGQLQPALPVKGSADSGKNGENGMVFEGNTDDLPTVERPSKPHKPVPKPSVPSS